MNGPSTLGRISTKAPNVTTFATRLTTSSRVESAPAARVGLRLLEAQRDSLALAIDISTFT
jgi:hypothetical protein